MKKTPLEHTTQTLVLVHDPKRCKGYVCSIHNRSNHHMRAWPQLWRDDRALMERVCPHGIGHPDPDHMATIERLYPERARWEGIHGCDGCCAPSC